MRMPALLAAAVIALTACSTGSNDVTTVRADDLGAEAGPAGTPAPDDPSTDPGDPAAGAGSLEWDACERDIVIVPLECATLRVPLDHDDPDGETIGIAVARVRAGGADRIGSLVFNPGGPGGSGVEFLELVAATVPADVAARFDLVGFDPRGVGASTAVDCDIDIDDNITLLPPGDDAGWEDLVEEARMLATGLCPAEALAVAPYVGTNNAARDLDLLRIALGDEQLSYVGFSYGTRLGATYAELFPDRVRALVLDAAVRPSLDFEQLAVEQSEGFDLALENFAAACDADADCVLQDIGPALDVVADVRALVAAEGSLPTGDGERVLLPGELDLGIVAALYSRQAWPLLAEALRQAAAGSDGSLLQALGDSYTGRNPDGSYDNSTEANRFINCADDPARPPLDDVRDAAERAAAQSKFFGALLRADTGCVGTPDPIDPLTVGPAEGAPPILVIGNTGDPATPYGWSVALADYLDSGVLYTVEAEGHTAYTTIDCVAPVVDAYLIDLVVPPEGASCSDNDTADFFPPAGESEFDLVLALFDCLRDNGADIPDIDLADLLADPTGADLVALFDFSDPAFLDAALSCSDQLDELAGL